MNEYVSQPTAGVTVRVVKLRPLTLQIEGGSIVVLKQGTQMLPIPPNTKLEFLGPEGEKIALKELINDGGLFFTAETFDPFHVLVPGNTLRRKN